LSWIVYLLECSDGSYYTGITKDLKDRLERHSTGRDTKYTKARLPIKLVYKMSVRNESEAKQREDWLKHQTQIVKKQMIEEWSKASPKRG
jgi:putative endonuclease